MLNGKPLKTLEYKTKQNNAIITALFIVIIFALPPLKLVAEIPDSDITYWVKDAIYRDPRVDSYEINVTTKDGIVMLSGNVKDLAAKSYAALEAKKIDGVLGVINQITVSPYRRSDLDIDNAIRRRILNSNVIKSQGIFVNCKDGKVTLSGIVNTYSEEQEAGLIASEVKGVKEVENNIKTKWITERSDNEIKNDAESVLNRDVYLTGLPITVTVINGDVSLDGTVGSAYEKDHAYEDVRRIKNVKSVKNQLNVVWWERRGSREEMPSYSDADLKKAVRDELNQDIRLEDSDISINVAYGGVTLNGTVNSYYQKRIAEQDVQNVVGVGWVINNLFVHVIMREDWAILDDIKFNFNTDAVTEGFDIGVKVNNGIVTLTGNVNTWYQKLHAEEIAEKVKGVRKVVNQIEIYRETARVHTGTMVANNIKENFKRNWLLREASDRINVTVQNGVVTLSGEVDTWAQRRQAEEVAFNTEGVYKVNNHLQVKGYNYNWEDWYS
jgi:osmotically-inducible protein OsmY